MLLNILANTPSWVFGLFIALMILGLTQTRHRRVSLPRALGLPLGMTLFSLSGVLVNFAPHRALALTLWLAGALLWLALSQALAGTPRGRYHPIARQFELPGSWLPLAMIVGVFFVKYAIGVSLAMSPQAAADVGFVGVASGISGVLSGLFLATTVQRWQMMRVV